MYANRRKTINFYLSVSSENAACICQMRDSSYQCVKIKQEDQGVSLEQGLRMERKYWKINFSLPYLPDAEFMNLCFLWCS